MGLLERLVRQIRLEVRFNALASNHLAPIGFSITAIGASCLMGIHIILIVSLTPTLSALSPTPERN